MATSQIGVVRAQIVSSWTARLATDGITGVTVTGFDPGDEATKQDRAHIAEMRSSQQLLTMGAGTRSEDLDIDGVIWILKPGAGQTISKNAEDRALAVFASLENALRADTSLSSVFLFGEVAELRSNMMATPDGILCVAEFTVSGTINL